MTKIFLHEGDLPDGLQWGSSIAIDTETQGLSLIRDKLCVVQISSGDGSAHLVQMDRNAYDAPNLKALLADTAIEKIFHFARFDVAMIKKWLNVDCTPVFCTKIASKLVRTYTDRHGLKDVSRELVGVDMSKAQQSSDWGAEKLSDAQLAYAASDVLHLHEIRNKLQEMLDREGRAELAKSCFDFLPVRAQLDLEGWAEMDIFAHS
ncbi:MAG: ribonuclease D [Ponticaulis sp.]|nr:ribonuclease D [Ponticaulis sp.]|tara:strand:+ start:6800 stop:7417 length:618 start_codon:yes stop_codon:yes gene_type:complete